MPPRKTKDPAEPSSGGGAEPIPSPELEKGDSPSDPGAQPIGDPGLLRTVLEFRAAIGVEKPPPTPEKADEWRLGLEQLDLLQLQNLALDNTVVCHTADHSGIKQWPKACILQNSTLKL
eukprot:COSAG05_NODE_49_length_24373_cov_16.162561_6_plen_119_part_00